jgi:hypothetical protein
MINEIKTIVGNTLKYNPRSLEEFFERAKDEGLLI